MSTQLYARIKRTSKYAYQNDWEGYPSHFPVDIASPAKDDYIVKGGVGGQYRLADVSLYVKTHQDELIRISK
ncbi:hypothetical protein [Thiomicrorhabdus lithotrophica]|uniref:Uncharacterized protein n=1 Tax=Thiomicrorhabdus lithotrophica TaxID=2949997 RepID=A0ABY8C893_9GAMM|nr:hypothetical protein [Thiomicrorhabdus lithotrophica]WEJ62184.1 hypothetical protein NR989_09200 [Thiomicrorhabdus lithotrophica]